MSQSACLHTPTRLSRLRECVELDVESLRESATAQYLDDLRSNRHSKPSGSRPPPPSRFSALKRTETVADVTAARVQDGRPALLTSSSMPIMPAQTMDHKRTDSTARIKSPFAGRPLARPPPKASTEETPIAPTERPAMQRTPSMQYLERGTRWMEKQEARSLRMALEDMDLTNEKKVHDAAQDEAAELVWKHQNPDSPLANPDAPYANPDARRDYHSHLRKGSYQRSHSQEVKPVAAQRKTSGGSHTKSVSTSTTNKRNNTDVVCKVSSPSGPMSAKKMRTPSGKSYGGLAEAVAVDIANAHRRTSSGNKRILSGEKKLFMHPSDRIWEDPQEGHAPASKPFLDEQKPNLDPPTSPIPQQPAHIRKNPFARVRMQASTLERSKSEPIVTTPLHNSIEIQRNPPSQSRKPWYMSNEPLPPTPPSSRDQPADEVSPKVTPTKEGKEVRSDDLRAATSKQRKDYSPKLPRPTMVSDKPGRPIVSFKQDWKPKEVVLEEVHTAPLPKAQDEPCKTSSTVPRIDVDEGTRPPIPTIITPDEPTIPTIVLPEEPDFAEPFSLQSAPATPSINIEPPTFSIQGPEINVSEHSTDPSRPSQRPRPLPPTRPLPHHAATSPIPKSTPHYTPSIRQSGVLCAHCALPIAGRILSAAGERFHPSCFVCHQCDTNLELVAFYPEPEKQRSERLERISARQNGCIPEDLKVTISELDASEAEDGDPTLRFYCHLDFHELFSPRCKSCKTPIEGEVIVACGAEWHAGHFFCAQCGDPFDSRTPFVEKDGYAWCVGCHTNRYSSKCRKCRKPVTETVVKALGWDWHGACFVCVVSLCKKEVCVLCSGC